MAVTWTTPAGLLFTTTISAIVDSSVSASSASQYTLISGNLPDGLSLDASTGALSGTPTTAYTNTNVTFSVKDASNVTASTTKTINFIIKNGQVTVNYLVVAGGGGGGDTVAGGGGAGTTATGGNATGVTTGGTGGNVGGGPSTGGSGGSGIVILKY